MEAAQLFVRLSRGARQRGMPVRAAHLAVRAAQAYLAQDRVEPALNQMRLAVRILVRQGQTRRAARVASRVADELREQGFQTAADELAGYVDRLRQEVGLSADEWRAASAFGDHGQRGSLPERCAGCGAPLIADDITWHDAQTAECSYCGTVIKTI